MYVFACVRELTWQPSVPDTGECSRPSVHRYSWLLLPTLFSEQTGGAVSLSPSLWHSLQCLCILVQNHQQSYFNSLSNKQMRPKYVASWGKTSIASPDIWGMLTVLNYILSFMRIILYHPLQALNTVIYENSPIKLTLSGRGRAVSGPQYLFRLLSKRKTMELLLPRWKQTTHTMCIIFPQHFMLRYIYFKKEKSSYINYYSLKIYHQKKGCLTLDIIADVCVLHTNPSGRQFEGGRRGSREFPVSSSSSWLSGGMWLCVCVSKRSCRECKLSSAPKTNECSWAEVMSKTWITWRKDCEGVKEVPLVCLLSSEKHQKLKYVVSNVLFNKVLLHLIFTLTTLVFITLTDLSNHCLKCLVDI